ncbi:chondroitinase family polysaccharide lyase [Flavobacterium gilvum]|uniref:Chondroitin ABC lyase n=1 Tax=Flavobacterium gilvum TaxID=1492737 RepID=A0AAC9I275_9FLAO|nr:chondroitinase family polysaccharide lyase [Flavobacterium gilvum]AOW08570.1 hypothetical protein EM308_03135 [Flavobacterium gilvum]KFC58791.1 hypothetical protein FEM08_23890 [Flavobacterium gilvum]
MKKIFYLLFFYSISVPVFAQSPETKPIVESFENAKTLLKYQSSDKEALSVSDEHYLMGKQSLKWEWKDEKSSFGTGYFSGIPYDTKNVTYAGIFKFSPTFFFSVYNEKPQKGNFKISFLKNGKEEAWFNVSLNFTGWRRLIIPFYKMEGNRPSETDAFDFDYVQMSSNTHGGKLYFDDIIFSKYFDDRFSLSDGISPFYDKGILKDGQRLSNMQLLKQIKSSQVSEKQLKDLALIESKIYQKLLPTAVKYDMASLKERFAATGIFENGTTIKGLPLIPTKDDTYFYFSGQGSKTYNEIRPFGQLIQDIAKAYATTSNQKDKEELLDMFLLASRYFLDQGWQEGASNICRDVIYYATRELTPAFYIMKQPLHEAGILPQIERSLQWINNFGRIVNDDKVVDVDFLNTQSFGFLLQPFLNNDKAKQVTLLNAYSSYLSIILSQKEKAEGFRTDGTVWHHAGHYPAYGIGAFSTMGNNLYLLSGTGFKISKAGHENFKKALMATAIYSQLYDTGFGNDGRHPFVGSIISLKSAFLDMAKAGNPQGTSAIDKDLAGAYIRLWKEDKDNVALFTKEGIKSQQMPGYTVFPYAATAVHRHSDWAALIKGYSKYLWASEIYVGNNRYGRYPANGTIELLNNEGEKGSGFVQEGWDWNRYPGATVIHLPFEKLESPKSLLMFLSEQSFVGAATLTNNGVFGFILDESKGSNSDGLTADRSVGFEGKLKAKKSVFSFGDKLICIGTDISAVDKEYPVQTNLFQTFLKDDAIPVYTDAGAVSSFPISTEAGKRIVDPFGNGYYVISQQNIQMSKKKQQSYLGTYSVNNGPKSPETAIKKTEGDFAAAWIDHGTAPQDASYQYVIYPFMSSNDQQNFKAKTEADAANYKIIRADNKAHIVLDKTSNTMGCVFFEAGKYDDILIREVSDPSILMLQQKADNALTLGAVQPDLNFSKGNETRSGFIAYSEPVTLTIILNGKWKTGNYDFVKSVNYDEDTTIIIMQCRHGYTNTMELKK